MEAFLVIALIVAALFLASNAKQPSRRRVPPKARPIQRPSTAPQKKVPSNTGRFDEKTAKHLPRTQTLTGTAWVIDGDTIRIKNTQIRLFGIDAPELQHPYGEKAKWALHRLCRGSTIRAEVTDTDQHGRTVARCHLPDGRDLSAEMVKAGLAIDWRKFSGGAYAHMETPDARRRLFLADARQKGRMHVWRNFEARQRGQQG